MCKTCFVVGNFESLIIGQTCSFSDESQFTPGQFSKKLRARRCLRRWPVGFLPFQHQQCDPGQLIDEGDGDERADPVFRANHPPRSNRKLPEHRGDRDRVKRMSGKVEQHRQIANHHREPILSCESFLKLAAKCVWLKSRVDKA